MNAAQDIAGLKHRVERNEQSLYGIGHPRGVGLMSRVEQLERIAADEKAARRWLAALVITTLVGAAQTILRMWIG